MKYILFLIMFLSLIAKAETTLTDRSFISFSNTRYTSPSLKLPAAYQDKVDTPNFNMRLYSISVKSYFGSSFYGRGSFSWIEGVPTSKGLSLEAGYFLRLFGFIPVSYFLGAGYMTAEQISLSQTIKSSNLDPSFYHAYAGVEISFSLKNVSIFSQTVYTKGLNKIEFTDNTAHQKLKVGLDPGFGSILGIRMRID